jgi:hypothetical protein
MSEQGSPSSKSDPRHVTAKCVGCRSVARRIWNAWEGRHVTRRRECKVFKQPALAHQMPGGCWVQVPPRQEVV